MERTEIIGKTKQIMNRILDADNIELDSHFRDFGGDSLDKLEVVMECEKEFQIGIEDYLYDDLITVEDFVKVIESKIGALSERQH